jgi:predicted ArsR family transcriptional regulator
MNMNTNSNPVENWTFFSNNAHVLVCLTKTPQPTTREIAIEVGITERAVQRVLSRLIAADVIQVEKLGRRNTYTINAEKRLRHPLESHRTIGEFIKMINK